jgi:hypothetical protein
MLLQTGERGNEGDEQELPQVKAVEASGSILSEAMRQLAAMRSSSYTHTTHVDEASGTFDYDCSGLIDYSLARVAPAALRELQQATVHRPLAKHFRHPVSHGGCERRASRLSLVARQQIARARHHHCARAHRIG